MNQNPFMGSIDERGIYPREDGMNCGSPMGESDSISDLKLQSTGQATRCTVCLGSPELRSVNVKTDLVFDYPAKLERLALSI